MAHAVKPVPDGLTTVTPYMYVKNAAAALDFYKKAFGAKELSRFVDPKGQIGHAEIKIGDARIMLSEEHPEMGARSPQSLGGSPVSLLVYVPDADARFNQALSAGAKELRPVKDQFYGDRSGRLLDPFGHIWDIATHIEDVPVKEIERRLAKAMAPQPNPQPKTQ